MINAEIILISLRFQFPKAKMIFQYLYLAIYFKSLFVLKFLKQWTIVWVLFLAFLMKVNLEMRSRHSRFTKNFYYLFGVFVHHMIYSVYFIPNQRFFFWMASSFVSLSFLNFLHSVSTFFIFSFNFYIFSFNFFIFILIN